MTDLCLEVVSRSRQPLRYIWRWISREPLEIEVWFQRTTNRKWHMGYRIVTWPMTSRDPQRRCEAVRSAILATAWLLVHLAVAVSNLQTCSLAHLKPHRRTPYCLERRCADKIQYTHKSEGITLLTPTVAIIMGTAIIFDIRAFWRSRLSVRDSKVPRCQKLQMTA